MRELIISDITEMGSGLCIVGIERTGNGFRSVRPLPPVNYAWPSTTPCKRGSFVRFEPAPTSVKGPHTEDQSTCGLTPAGEPLEEDELVDLLQHSETAENAEGLFGCGLRTERLGGNAWVAPDIASRSICGCSCANLRFRTFLDAGKVKLVAMLALTSGEVLHSVPLVDWVWRQFVAQLIERVRRPSARAELDNVFNQSIRPRIMDSSTRFLRMGLPRPRLDESKCWLMLDSLFPQPDITWLDDILQ